MFLLILLIGLSCLQFFNVLWPQFFHSAFTAADRFAMERVALYVPSGECIHINREAAGAWIPVVGFRCTIPQHPLSESARDELKEWDARSSDWQYLAAWEKGVKADGQVVFDNGARIVRKSAGTGP